MAELCAFRQHEEKHVSAEVELMVWSPKMDLLAVANVQGEVVLHRLSWQKVWTLAPPGEEVKVRTLAWRPDGKVLAVGYVSGKVIICDVENASPLHDLQLDAALTSMTWVSQVKPEAKSEETTETDCYQDTSAQFLPRLPHFPKSYTTLSKGQSEDNVWDAKRLKGQTELNILVIGTESGILQMYAYGVFPVGTVDLTQHGTGRSGVVVSGHLSSDLRLLSLMVTVAREDANRKDAFLICFDTTLLASRDRELRMLALKFGQVLTLMTYVDSTIQQMCEAWEDILLEMDSKLLKFAEEKQKSGGGCVSNDFLRLLMMGTPSDELQAFLMHELTDKGLKKLGHSIETSYSNIQKLVLKHLQSVGQCIVYQLTDIRGMALWYDKFGVLGLSTPPVQDAIMAGGTFMLKASELQQVIDRSMKNFKAFFRWLYVVIRGLSEEPVPQELSKMTQQDLSFVAQFLKENFTKEMESSGFKLEKVGQYLKDEDLTDPPDNSANPWVRFLEENPSLKDGGQLYEAKPTQSLIQTHKHLQRSINAALNKCASVIGQSLQCVSTACIFPLSEDNEDYKLQISQFSKTIGDTTYLYSAFTTMPIPCDRCYILRQTTTGQRTLEVVAMEFGEMGSSVSDVGVATHSDSHQVLDVAFYDDNLLSVLLQETHQDGLPVLLQVPLSVAEDRFTLVPMTTDALVNQSDVHCVRVSTAEMEGLMLRRLDNMKAARFAVSGTRKVACVLFSSRRRVRLFIMDAEDEEEEEEEEEAGDAEDSQLTADGQTMTDDDEDKENSRESGAMDV